MNKVLPMKAPLRIPEGMLEVHCHVVPPARVDPNAPTEILAALEDPMGDPVRRSGEYKLSPETEALMKSVREAAVAETTRELTIQSLTKSVAEVTGAVDKLAGEVSQSNKILATVATTQSNHAQQLESMWDEKKSKNSAWHAFWPTVVGSILSALILAIFAMSGAFSPKEMPAPAAPPAVPKVP